LGGAALMGVAGSAGTRRLAGGRNCQALVRRQGCGCHSCHRYLSRWLVRDIVQGALRVGVRSDGVLPTQRAALPRLRRQPSDRYHGSNIQNVLLSPRILELLQISVASTVHIARAAGGSPQCILTSSGADAKGVPGRRFVGAYAFAVQIFRFNSARSTAKHCAGQAAGREPIVHACAACPSHALPSLVHPNLAASRRSFAVAGALRS